LAILQFAVTHPNAELTCDQQCALLKYSAAVYRHLATPPLHRESQRSRDRLVRLLTHDDPRTFVSDKLTPKDVTAIVVGNRSVQSNAKLEAAQTRLRRSTRDVRAGQFVGVAFRAPAIAAVLIPQTS
jgi:hypothetical protein